MLTRLSHPKCVAWELDMEVLVEAVRVVAVMNKDCRHVWRQHVIDPKRDSYGTHQAEADHVLCP